MRSDDEDNKSEYRKGVRDVFEAIQAILQARVLQPNNLAVMESADLHGGVQDAPLKDLKLRSCADWCVVVADDAIET